MIGELAAVLLLSALGAPARAGAEDCVACCQEAGLVGCPTRVRVFGDGSLATREGPAWRVIGLWRVDCEEGAEFENGRTVVLDHEPRPGEVLRLAYPPATVRCFAEHCGLPPGACIHEKAEGVFVLEGCTDGRTLTATEMRVRPAASHPPQQRVRIGHRTILATPAAPAARSVRVVPAPPERPAIEVRLSLPDPPRECAAPGEDRVLESRRHVDLGDEARLAGEHQRAADEYRAALTVDPCNALAWAALGELALDARRPEDAVRALRVATRLMPDHWGALTSLGEAYEAMGRTELAADAFRRALELNPDHPRARDGLARVAGEN